MPVEAKDLFRDIVETTDNLVIKLDHEGRIAYINPAGSILFGEPARDFSGKSALSFLHEKDQVETKKRLAEFISAGVGGGTLENRVLDKAGQVRHMTWTLNFKYDHEGGLAGINAVGKDISEHMAMEQEHRSNQEVWNKLFMASPAWILLASLDSGDFLDCNDIFCQDTGFSKEEVIGRTTKELGLWSGPEERNRILNMIEDRERIDKLPLKMRVRGVMRDFLWSCIIVDVQGRDCLLSVLVDVSDLKKTEEQLAAANRELQSRSQELADMNSALKVLLKQREEDKNDLESRMWHNLKMMIQPHIFNLRQSGLNPTQLAHLDVIDHRLGEISSNLGRSLGRTAHGLTSRELEVAGHVLEGKTNKDIAEVLNISIYSVHSHRQAIRKKLGILGARENLRAHLARLSKSNPDSGSSGALLS